MQRIKLRTEESGEKLSAAYAPPKWSETAEEEDLLFAINTEFANLIRSVFSNVSYAYTYIYELLLTSLCTV